MNNIYLIYGRSGVGKTTVATELCKRYGYKQIASYTDRAPRYPGEQGHVFISTDAFNKLRPQMVAYTLFDGHQYGVTAGEIDHNDIYVIDAAGIADLRRNYHGSKRLVVIRIVASAAECQRRMAARGDSTNAILQRAAFDASHAQAVPNTEWNVYNDYVDRAVDALHEIIVKEEAEV